MFVLRWPQAFAHDLLAAKSLASKMQFCTQQLSQLRGLNERVGTQPLLNIRELASAPGILKPGSFPQSYSSHCHSWLVQQQLQPLPGSRTTGFLHSAAWPVNRLLASSCLSTGLQSQIPGRVAVQRSLHQVARLQSLRKQAAQGRTDSLVQLRCFAAGA